MRKKLATAMSSLLVLVALTACAKEAAPPQSTPIPEPTPVITPSPTPTPTPSPTPSPEIEMPPVEVFYSVENDTNKDGVISKQEWEAWVAAHPEDTNKNMLTSDDAVESLPAATPAPVESSKPAESQKPAATPRPAESSKPTTGNNGNQTTNTPAPVVTPAPTVTTPPTTNTTTPPVETPPPGYNSDIGQQEEGRDADELIKENGWETNGGSISIPGMC